MADDAATATAPLREARLSPAAEPGGAESCTEGKCGNPSAEIALPPAIHIKKQ